MHTIDELREKQALPLSIKIALTRERIRAWINEFGESGVYVSFSGGKDSTVLLDIVWNVCGYKEVPAVFVDIPTQYPELREFVKTFDNTIILKPKINFFKVCEKYGFPLISKEVSQTIWEVKNALEKGKDAPIYRMRKLNGQVMDKNGQPSVYNIPQYKFLLDAPFHISHQCCNYLKKRPVKTFENFEKRVPILAMMAEESFLRKQKWLQHGCNAFDSKRPMSNPMSFWTEQDVLEYIRQYDLKICSVYGEVVTDDEEMGQLTWADCGITGFEQKQPLHCTGCQRTGCVLCGFGSHMPDDKRFLLLKESHPKMYQFLDVAQNNGYTMRQAIDWINEHGNMNIKY